MEEQTIEVYVYEENCCDDLAIITNSNGFSLYTLIEINKDLQEYDLSDFYNKTLIIKPSWNEAQIGGYPPPNIECEGYWYLDIIDVKDEPICDFSEAWEAETEESAGDRT